MTRTPDDADGRTSRRTFLGLVGLAAGAGAAGSANALPAFRGDAGSTGQFSIQQGEECIPVTPLTYEDDTVTDFYGYSKEDYESHTATKLEASDVSQLFLYRDPDGGLSLAIIHDMPEGSEGTGGAATFSFEGLASDGEWVVKNDNYDGANEIWDTTETHENDTVHWAWNNWHADGGVFSGLGSDVELTIDPAFNEAAKLDPEVPGEISQWQFVSGDPADPDRISLDMDEPLTIRTGACSADVPETVSAELDVDPGEGAVVNPRSRGRLPVALLSSDSFDATTVDPETIAFGPGNAAPVHLTETDVNGDGRADLLMHFEMAATGIVVNTTKVTLNAKTTGGTRVSATDTLDIVANRDDEKEKREHEKDHEETEQERKKETTEDDEETTTSDDATESDDAETESDGQDETERGNRERQDDTGAEDSDSDETKREQKREKREKREEKREKKREKREEKRAEKRKEKREKREEKREKHKEKREGKREEKREDHGHHDDDDDDDDDGDDGDDDDGEHGNGRGGGHSLIDALLG